MFLRDLTDRGRECNVVIFQTTSDKLRMFMQDNIKRRYDCNSDTIISCTSKKDYKQVHNIMNVIPPFSKKWFIDVDLDHCNDKEFVSLVKDATTCVFFCNVKKYVTYKRFKESIKGLEGVFDYYITYLKRYDFLFLYDAFVPEKNRLSKTLFDYVVQSYSGDIESVFDLFLELNKGREITSRKEIAEICGVGGNSVESFIISLLKDPPTTERGLKKVMKNRLVAGKELAEVYRYSSFYRLLRKTLTCFIQIKVLIISGVVYKQIRKLPEGYDEKSLVRYQRYVWRLKEIPLSRILRLYKSLGNSQWSSDIEFINFVYRFLFCEENELVLKGGKNNVGDSKNIL